MKEQAGHNKAIELSEEAKHKRKGGRERRVRYFNSVEGVEAEVIGEMGGWCDLQRQSVNGAQGGERGQMEGNARAVLVSR